MHVHAGKEVSAAFSRRYRENQLTALVSKEVEQRAKVYPIRWTIAKFSRCIVESRFVPGSQGYRRVILTIFESIYLWGIVEGTTVSFLLLLYRRV